MDKLGSFLNAWNIKDPTFVIYEDVQYIRASIELGARPHLTISRRRNIDIPLSEIIDFDKKNHLLITEESVFKIKSFEEFQQKWQVTLPYRALFFYNMLTDKTGLKGRE